MLNGLGGDDVLLGSFGRDTLNGGEGKDTPNGGDGVDNLIGLKGDDTYVFTVGDTINEALGSGIDTVRSNVSFNLSGGAIGGDVENLTLTGFSAVNAAGNALANFIVGNEAANVINGRGGDDTLTGGGGADAFVFDTTLSQTTNLDLIDDFSTVLDTIRLENAVFTGLAAGALAGSAFRIGAAADATDWIIYNKTTGDLSFDADGTGGKAGIILAELDSNLAMTSTDFLVI